MSYVIDPEKNWALAATLAEGETDPARRRNLQTLIAHAKAEAAPDFDALMATVAPNASYTSYAGSRSEANSPTGYDEVASYYRGIVDAGMHHIEHHVERMAVGDNVITTEGDLKIAYPGALLGQLGLPVPDETVPYLFQSRLIIVWEFDEEGRVLCEDSYSAGGPDGFDGIAERPIDPAAIRRGPFG